MTIEVEHGKFTDLIRLNAGRLFDHLAALREFRMECVDFDDQGEPIAFHDQEARRLSPEALLGKAHYIAIVISSCDHITHEQDWRGAEETRLRGSGPGHAQSLLLAVVAASRATWCAAA